jgi:hypothetical protein
VPIPRLGLLPVSGGEGDVSGTVVGLPLCAVAREPDATVE